VGIVLQKASFASSIVKKAQKRNKGRLSCRGDALCSPVFPGPRSLDGSHAGEHKASPLQDNIFPVELPVREGFQLDIKVGVQGVDMFGEVNIDNPVIVETETFAEGVLRNFKSSVKVAFQGGGEVEIEEESEITLAQLIAQFFGKNALAFKRTQQRLYLLFELAGNLGTDTMSINGRVLLVDAGRKRKSQA
jgi:hypothetical protein